MQILNAPRTQLAVLPTPMQYAGNLSAGLGINLWIKRDDLTGFALGGNKVRKLEFLLGDAGDKNCDHIVAAGGPGSNHLRLTVAAAKKLGFGITLVMYGDPPSEARGNFKLIKLMAPEIIFTGNPDRATVDEFAEREAARLNSEGKKAYLIPRGGATAVGSLGYATAMTEIHGQSGGLGLTFDHFVLPVGSCGTLAGLLAGARSVNFKGKFWGLSVSRPKTECERVTSALTAEILGFAAGANAFAGRSVDISDEFIGEGYGKSSLDVDRVIRDVAAAEGIFLDPVFSGKAMWGLTELVKSGRIRKGQTVLFLHTGGHPALFT